MVRRQGCKQKSGGYGKFQSVLVVPTGKKRATTIPLPTVLAKPSKSHAKYCKVVRRAKAKARRAARTSLVNSSVIKSVPVIIQNNRQSRPRERTRLTVRKGSAPRRHSRFRQEVVKRFPEVQMTRDESSSSEDETTQWLWPFLDNSSTTPRIRLKVDSIETVATVDSGASRVMITYQENNPKAIGRKPGY